MTITIHKTAIVDDGAKLGDGCRVWHWVHICGGAVIGDNCSFGQNVFIGNRVKIGNNVKIQNNVSVYDNITIGNDVFCGPSMVFTNVYNPRSAIPRKEEYRATIVEDGVTFGANSTIVCGTTIGKSAFIAAGSVITKNVKNFALMAGNPGVQIGWMSLFGKQLELPLSGDGETTCSHTGQKYLLRDGHLLVLP